MAILQECSQCGRKGGYAYSADDTICGRCMKDQVEGRQSRSKSKDKDKEGQE